MEDLNAWGRNSSKKQGVMAGSIAESSGKGNNLQRLVWKQRAGWFGKGRKTGAQETSLEAWRPHGHKK